jgi:hypothetical protein
VVVDRDDTLPTICGKLDAAPLPEAAVIVPHGNAELSTAVGMRLLMRHAQWSGKTVVLVTRRQAIRQVAHAEGQRYVGSDRQVRFSRRRSAAIFGGVDLPIPNTSSVAWLLGIGLVVLIVAAAVFWYLPSATVTLFPPTKPISAEQSIQIDPVANRVNQQDGIAPADRRSVFVRRSIVLPATGSASVQQVSGDPVVEPAVSDADIQSAKNLAGAALTDQAVQDLGRTDGDGWIFFPQTANVDVKSVDVQEKSGAATPFFPVTYTGTVSILGAKQSDLQNLLTPHLREQVHAGDQVVDSSMQLTVERSGPLDKNVDRLPMLVRLDAATTAQLDAAKIQRTLRGKRKHDALALAAGAIDAVRPPALKLSPGWAPWLPRLSSRIHVELSSGG